MVFLCVDTLLNSVVAGFGFDPINDDYKIVSLSYKQPRGVLNSSVYAIKTGVWSEIASPSIVLSLESRKQCFVNGALHWIVKYYLNDTDEIGHLCIMTLDLTSHVFGTIELLDPTWLATTLFSLIEINVSLALLCNDGINTWIWVRRREYDNVDNFSWHVDYKLKQDDIYGLRRVLQLTANGNLLLDSCFQTRMQSILAEFSDSSLKFGMEICAESLELLDIGTPYDKVNPPLSSSSVEKQKNT